MTKNNFRKAFILISAILILTTNIAFAAEVIIYSNEQLEENSNSLILDNDNTGGNVILQFGDTLNERLYWSSTGSTFIFTDDLNVQGTLDVDGSTLTLDADDTGGNVDLIFGTTVGEYLRHDGTLFTFSDDLLMPTDKQIQFRDTALTINSSIDGQLDIDADTEIELTTTTVDINGDLDLSGSLTGATIDGDSNTIQNLNWTSIKTRTKKLNIDISDLTVLEDGSDNLINLYSDSETGANPHEFYIAKTTQATLQDIDLRLKIRLPEDFVDFTTAANDIGFWYKNTGVNNTDSKIDILVEDDDGDDAFTAADGQGLFSATWTSYTDEFDGASFNPAAGEYIYVTIKGYASNDSGYQSPYIGELAFTYTGK